MRAWVVRRGEERVHGEVGREEEVSRRASEWGTTRPSRGASSRGVGGDERVLYEVVDRDANDDSKGEGLDRAQCVAEHTKGAQD